MYVTLNDFARASGMGQAATPTCVLTMPTNTAAEEAAIRFAAMTDAEKLATRTPYLAQVASLPAAEQQPEADRRVIAALAEQVARERLLLRLCQDIVRELVDQIVGPAPLGAPASFVATTFPRERLYAVRDYALSRGVPLDRAIQSIRSEVFRRLPGHADPYPNGDLENLNEHLLRIAAPPTVYQPPIAAPLPPPVFQTLAPAPVPAVAPAAQPAQPAQQAPALRQRRPRLARSESAFSSPLVIAGGLVAAALIYTSFSKG